MGRNPATLLILLMIVVCLLVTQFYSPYSTSYKAVSPAKTVEWKYILYWTQMFGRPDFNLGLGSDIFRGCPVSNCYATDNKSYLPVDRFDAILFHGVEYSIKLHGRPKVRSQHQYYVYSSQESPLNTLQFPNLTDFYNWTMTYRLDSDIVRPYGFYEKTKADYDPPSIEELQRRPFKIAWMVSNCETLSLRKVLYEKLNRHIKVDVYGHCGNITCLKQNSEKCYRFLEENYKFYLSFENSICKDYVTEKMYNILQKNLVPIVYGGADYEKNTPPHSVIDVKKFKTVKELAEYINFLDKNPEEYLKYFEWKNRFIVRTSNERTLCSLCSKLNEPIKHKSYASIFKWWNIEETCQYGSTLPKILYT
ncbi:hypothetical protein NQ318_008642 [Aromia moschata]|uniref:Fucosyltransferase n=1 Tax=Aromia moschata TaxID=1265417 RepID=A0AAV8YXQ4_9CUCU|nr:hypothetical protein NQ318_008642 [Aromia moschata]